MDKEQTLDTDRGTRASRREDSAKKTESRSSSRSDSRTGRTSATSKKAKKKKHSRDLDVAIFLTLVVISAAVIVAVLFAAETTDEYSTAETLTLEGVEVSTLSAVVGQRRVIEVEEDSIQGALSSKVLQYAVYDEGRVTGENLRDYGQFLVNNENFAPLELSDETSDFLLAKSIEGGRVFQIRAHYTAGESASLDYAILADAEKYDILARFAEVNSLFVEHGLDTAPLLAEAGGLNEQFWGFALSEVMEQAGIGDLLSRFLEIATAD